MTRPLPRFVNAFTGKGRRYYYFRKPGAGREFSKN